MQTQPRALRPSWRIQTNENPGRGPVVCLPLAMLWLMMVITTATAKYSERVLPLLPPEGGAYFGVASDIKALGVEQYDRQLGESPASYVIFVDLPLAPLDKSFMDRIMPQIAARNAFVLLTVEPNKGLEAVTDAALAEFVAELARHEAAGSIIIVRFAHEMNGSWYKWGQAPTLYRATFRRVAAAVYKATKNATMLWAPNSGGGYPFIVGQRYINCTFDGPVVRPDCIDLDTNGDKELTVADDMYTPFYPGDDVVDFVGMSIYHFGQEYPYGLNVDPEPSKFVNLITGNYDGLQGDYRPVLDFYQLFCTPAGGHDKPMIIGETAAFYNLCNLPNTTSRCAQQEIPPTERHLKEAWWTQVFNVRGPSPNGPDVAAAFPALKLVHWFDIVKPEVEAQGNTVSWSISANDAIRKAFLDYLALPRLFPNGSESATRYWHFARGQDPTMPAGLGQDSTTAGIAATAPSPPTTAAKPSNCSADPTTCQPLGVVLQQEGFEGQATAFRSQVNATAGAQATFDFHANGAGAAHGGTFSARVVINRRGTQPWHVQIAGPILDLVAGNVYRANVWIRADHAATAGLAIVANTRSYTLLPGSDLSMSLAGTYQQFQMTVTADKSGPHFLTVDFGAVPVSVAVYIDDIVISTNGLPLP